MQVRCILHSLYCGVEGRNGFKPSSTLQEKRCGDAALSLLEKGLRMQVSCILTSPPILVYRKDQCGSYPLHYHRGEGGCEECVTSSHVTVL